MCPALLLEALSTAHALSHPVSLKYIVLKAIQTPVWSFGLNFFYLLSFITMPEEINCLKYQDIRQQYMLSFEILPWSDNWLVFTFSDQENTKANTIRDTKGKELEAKHTIQMS